MEHLSKFHLNRTVNESRIVVLQKLRKPEKMVAPSAHKSRRLRLAVQNRHLAVPVPQKVQKKTFFVNRTPCTSLVWRLAANWVSLDGSCSFRNPTTLPLHLRTSTSPTILISFNFDSMLTTQRFRITIHPISL